jgi:Cytochrome P460
MKSTGLRAAMLVLLVVTAGACSSGPEITGKGDAAITRPDVSSWVSIGATLRVTEADPALPNQFRHVQLEPSAYKALLAAGAYPDGARLAVTFYSAHHVAEMPTLYAEDKEVFFGIEVIDKGHPDGRRFYNFTDGAISATPLPAGNACAVCHNAKGGLQGTFAQHYPVIVRYAKAPGGS